MQALTTFNFKNQDIRVYMVDDEPRWVAKDVCDILGLSDGRTSVDKLDEDERHTMPVIDSLGREQETLVVTEPGLYSLILRSRKKEAKEFKRWITHEVLPAIRKTGSYSVAHRDPIAEIERLAIAIQPVIGGINNRLSVVEERQKQVDPQEIERRMVFLNECKNLLVVGTKGKPQSVTHPKFWQELKKLIGINSFQNRAALTVELMDRCVAYAKEWCEARGVNPPSLFDAA